jgi:hypothetical protein
MAKPMNRVEQRITNELQEQEEDGMKIIEPFSDEEWEEKGMGIIEPFSDKAWEAFSKSCEESLRKNKVLKPDFHGDFGAMDDNAKDSIINPTHYKIIPKEAYLKYPDGMQYMDIMEYALAHLSGQEAAVMSQVFKYSLRIGKKDHKLQDAEKICWYANYMAKTVKNNKEDPYAE